MAAQKTNRIRVAGGAAALIAAGALSVAMAAPASANVTSVGIDTPSGYGSSQGVYGAGCSYKVSAKVSSVVAKDKVTFSVTPAGGSPTQFAEVEPTEGGSNTVTATWKPSAPGVYTITASQNGNAKTVDNVKVANGIQLPDWFWGGNCLITG
ncbi:hypothetical protein GYA93_19675 [Gordonia desulfuricans]|uniref:Ig-like domain repeat protein n=1 Tax=Gordonia desulfuricans TaxID=89051 RepID=A0A7K3LU37_9ACTN|nr:hypothetical protein [Gordonia desulfuricans]NDK91773.1 hypothetical protein [Gordonia desulfuricans]